MVEDDTMPLPADVERAFLECDVGDVMGWLEENGVDASLPDAKIVQYLIGWNPETERYEFSAYDTDCVYPSGPMSLAVPILEDGKFIDLLLIGDDMSFTMACRATQWLGRDSLKQDTVRLHAHPMDWLEAGRTGACHVALISRQALKELRVAKSIVCNDVVTAFEAWDWAFGTDEDELSRFVIDDTAESIRDYFKFNARCLARGAV